MLADREGTNGAVIVTASALASLAVLVLLAASGWHLVGSAVAGIIGTVLLIPAGPGRAVGQGVLLGGLGLVLLTAGSRVE